MKCLCELVVGIICKWFQNFLGYCIVENFGGGKYWRIWQIKQRFAKVLPSKFYQNVFEVERL